MSSLSLDDPFVAAIGPRPIGKPQSATNAAGSSRAFTFAGKGLEYFGIWIVNLLLTILTLGIYSAWAKVRTKQYFYGNTQLEGASLQYVARPLTILKGRILVFGVLAIWAVISRIYPDFDLFMLLLVVPAITPWIVVRALRFAMRNTSHRHIRFDFTGSTREAFAVYVLLWAGTILSLGLLHPYAVYRRARYRVEHVRYGETRFGFDGEARAFNRAYLLAAAIVLPFLLGAAALVAATGAIPALIQSIAQQRRWYLGNTDALLLLLAALLLALGLLIAAIQVAVAVAMLTWNHTRIGGLRFSLDLSVARMVWIRLTNLVAIVLSAGLLIPWTRVRLARYQIGRLRLTGTGDLDRFLTGEVQRLGATGAEMGDALELDLGM